MWKSDLAKHSSIISATRQSNKSAAFAEPTQRKTMIKKNYPPQACE
jgi:hypothetical protein